MICPVVEEFLNQCFNNNSDRNALIPKVSAFIAIRLRDSPS